MGKSNSSSRFSRRSLLAASSSAALLAGTGMLGGCTDSTRSESPNDAGGRDSNESSDLVPNFKAYAGVTPDLPTSVAGSVPVFYTYPDNRPKSVEQTPGAGGSISSMSMIYLPAPPSPPSNAYWNGLNKRLGVKLELLPTSAADYATKFATTVAGDVLPDAVQIPNSGVPNLPKLLAARFADLTSYLSGSAAEDYPNLAGIPTSSWRNGIHNGALYGIPTSEGLANPMPFVRTDRFEEAKVSQQPTSWDEFLETSKALTDPARRRWAFGPIWSLQPIIMMMVGAPNKWKAGNGSLTADFETEEWMEGLSKLVTMWKAGVMHPDAFSNSAPFKQWFYSGTTAIAHDGYKAYDDYTLKTGGGEKGAVEFMTVPKAEGGGTASFHLGDGYFTISAINKKSSPDRIREILRVMDWLAAPFGTEEHFYLRFGEEGVDYKLSSDGQPQTTPVGIAEHLEAPWGLATPPDVLYTPGMPKEHNRRQQAYMDGVIPTGTSNPVSSLYSTTEASQGSALKSSIQDAVGAVVQGRKPMSYWKDAISKWRSSGGDKMRSEFEKQL